MYKNLFDYVNFKIMRQRTWELIAKDLKEYISSIGADIVKDPN